MRNLLTNDRFALLAPYFIIAIGLYAIVDAWAALAGYHLYMFGLILHNGLPTLNFPRQQSWLNMLLLSTTMLGCALTGVIILQLWPWLTDPSTNALATLSQKWKITPTQMPFFALYFGLVNPLLEELYWRGVLESRNHPTWRTSFGFAGYHWLVLAPLLDWWWLLSIFCLLAGVGWWWNQLNRRVGSIGSSVLCHIVADCSIVAAFIILLV